MLAYFAAQVTILSRVVPDSVLVWPVVSLIAIAIVMTTLGLLAKGRPSYSNIGVMGMIGLVTGVLGFFALVGATIDYQWVASVCQDSKTIPSDTAASWACPQADAANVIVWALEFGLLVPIMLFLVAPSIRYLQLRKGVELSADRVE